MFHRYAHWKRRKRPGATLVEMLIALIILVVMLFSIMAVIVLTSQNTVATKEAQGAYLTGLGELEKREAQKVSDDIASNDMSTLGSYSMKTKVTGVAVSSLYRSGDITVEASWEGARNMKDVTLGRQVSPSAWQNAGQLP